MASKNLHTFAFGKASPIYAFGSGSIFFRHPCKHRLHTSAVALQPIPLRSIRCSQRTCCLVFFCQAFAQSSSAATFAPQTPIRFRYAHKCLYGVQPPLIVVLACWSLGLIGLSAHSLQTVRSFLARFFPFVLSLPAPLAPLAIGSRLSLRQAGKALHFVPQLCHLPPFGSRLLYLLCFSYAHFLLIRHSQIPLRSICLCSHFVRQFRFAHTQPPTTHLVKLNSSFVTALSG